MTKTIFHHKELEIKGIIVPEFDLNEGELIRIYVPNFNFENSPLGFDLTIELIKRFQNQKNEFPWAKYFQQSSISLLFSPLTVGKYLIKKMKIDKQTAKEIAEEIGIELNDRYEIIDFIDRRALIIKALFEKNESIIIDYYGISAEGIGKLESVVNSEIEKGKSAIAFDRLEFKADKEPFKNIIPIEIKNCTQQDICDHSKQLEF
ncbi:hypothetical protein U0D62_07495 [Aquimarina sp. 2201CG5-10]|nr:hypothetical protein [Aquimarina sp. 2201CG5-10]